MADNNSRREPTRQDKLNQDVDDITGFLSTRGGGFFIIGMIAAVILCTIVGKWVL